MHVAEASSTIAQTPTRRRLSARRVALPLEGSIFCGLLLCSGFCGISYEILYARVLGNLMGDQMAVSASILMTFLVGIGLGTRYAHCFWRFLWLIELGIGLCGLLFAFGTGPLDFALYVALPWLGGGLGASVLLCVLLLVVPAGLVGCSLPLFAGYLSRLQKGRIFAKAYTFYNVGAALTALLIEFWIVRTFGLRGALVAIASLNVTISVVLVTGYGRLRWQQPDRAGRVVFGWRDKLALALVSVASAIFQLMMIKVAQCIVGPFHETFALVLAIVLLGIAAGSALADRLQLGFAAVVSIALFGLAWFLSGFDTVAELYARLYPLAVESYAQSVLLKFGSLALLMALPAMAFGATIPALLRDQKNIARESGELLFISSMGNAVGFLVMAFVLHRALDYGMITLVIAGLSGVGLLVRTGWHLLPVGAVAALLLGSLGAERKVWDEDLLYVGHTEFHSAQQLEATRAKLRLPEKFKGYQDVFAITEMDGVPYFFINGYLSIPLTSPSEKIVGAFAAVFAPDTKRALVLGVGSGATAGTVGQLFDQTDAVEINPVVLENLYRMKQYNFGIEASGRVHIIQDDAIHFVKAARAKYSLIINTVTTPLYFSSSKLYTDDFLRQVKPRLAHGGVYVTWVDSRVGDRGLDIMLRTIRQSFDYCSVGCVKSSYFLLLCSDRPIRARQPHVVSASPALRNYFQREQSFNPDWFAYGLLCVDAFSLIADDRAPVHTLDYPALEFEMTRLRKRGIRRFKQRLRDHMDLDQQRLALSPEIRWDAAALLRHIQRLLGDTTITDRWSELVEQRYPEAYQQAQLAKIDKYARRARTLDSADAHHKYGYELLKIKQYERAIAELKRALELDPNHDNTHFNLGACYEYLEQYDEALEQYEAERAVDPDDDDVPYRIGRTALKAGRYEQAAAALRRAILICDDSENHQLLGQALAALGRREQAAAEFAAALALDPDNQQAASWLSRLRRRHWQAP